MASIKRDRKYINKSIDDALVKKQQKLEEKLHSLYEKQTKLIKKINCAAESEEEPRKKEETRQQKKLTYACGVALEDFYRSREVNARQFLRGQLRDTIHDENILLNVLARFDAIDAETINNEFVLEEGTYWTGN